MQDQTPEFRQRLFAAQEMTPALHEAYRQEVEQLLHPALTPRKALPGILLLVILLACTAGIVRSMFVYRPQPLVLLVWILLAGCFSWASLLIVRDLRRRKHSPASAASIAHGLTFVAGVATVAALLSGSSRPADPASTFNALYMFVFYFACMEWSLGSRIAASELAAKEQSLRIECRLADLAGRMQRPADA